MRTVQDIAFGLSGQSVYFDAPEGRPSSVTSVAVFRWSSSDDDAEDSVVGSGAVEANPDTTIAATSGAGQANPCLLHVTATTGVEAGRRYLVTSAGGVREWFDAESVDTDSVIARHPLHNAYAVDDTVQSTRITAALDASWIADETNLLSVPGPNPMYRVRWVYVVDSVSCVADSYFNLARYPGAHGLRPQDVEAMHPGWLDRLPVDHRNDQGRRLIDEAYRAVKFDLHMADVDDASVANSEIVDDLTRWKTLELGEFARVLSGGGDSQAFEYVKTEYQKRLDGFVRLVMRVPIRDVSGSATAARPAFGVTRR